MSDQKAKSIEQFMSGERDPEQAKAQRGKWQAFVSSDVLKFFDANKLEKLTIEDDSGNKAKLTRMKDDKVKIESSSVEIF